MTASPPPVYLYRVSVDGELRDYASVLPPETAQRMGLPAASIVGVFPHRTADGQPVLESFAANPAFVEVLNRVVGRYGPDEPELRAQAERIGSGYVYVIDGRTPDPAAPASPEDVVGAFQVREGKVVRDPYLPNPKHRLFTGGGFFQLSDTLGRRLLEEIASASGDA